MALAGNVGVDTIHGLFVGFIPGFTTTVTNTSGGAIFYQNALLGEVVPSSGNALREVGAAVTIGQNTYFRGETGGLEVNISQTPTPSPQFVGTTLVTSTNAQQVLEKMLIEQRVQTEALITLTGNAKVGEPLLPENTQGL